MGLSLHSLHMRPRGAKPLVKGHSREVPEPGSEPEFLSLRAHVTVSQSCFTSLWQRDDLPAPSSYYLPLWTHLHVPTDLSLVAAAVLARSQWVAGTETVRPRRLQACSSCVTAPSLGSPPRKRQFAARTLGDLLATRVPVQDA